jgi:hypothetical protein
LHKVAVPYRDRLSPSARAHVADAAATSSFGPAEAICAIDSNTMLDTNPALTVFEQNRMTRSSLVSEAASY